MFLGSKDEGKQGHIPVKSRTRLNHRHDLETLDTGTWKKPGSQVALAGFKLPRSQSSSVPSVQNRTLDSMKQGEHVIKGGKAAGLLVVGLPVDSHLLIKHVHWCASVT